MGGHPVLQTQVQFFQHFIKPVMLLTGAAPAQTRELPPTGCDGQVFFNHHAGRRPQHGILEHPADVPGPFMLRLFRNIHAVDDDAALVNGPDTGNGIQHGGLAGPVAADHRGKVSRFQVQGGVHKSPFFINRSGEKCFINMFYL